VGLQWCHPVDAPVPTTGLELGAAASIPGKRYLDWNLPGPAGLPLDEVRAIRDDIARRVNELVLHLDR
jgi:hypothetical protein